MWPNFPRLVAFYVYHESCPYGLNGGDEETGLVRPRLVTTQLECEKGGAGCHGGSPSPSQGLGRVCKLEPAGYTRRYETKRTYKHAMEAAPTAASASKTSNGMTCFGPSTHHQRHLVDSTYRCPMAGFAQALWLLEHRGQPLLSLAKSRYLATSL